MSAWDESVREVAREAAAEDPGASVEAYEQMVGHGGAVVPWAVLGAVALIAWAVLWDTSVTTWLVCALVTYVAVGRAVWHVWRHERARKHRYCPDCLR